MTFLRNYFRPCRRRAWPLPVLLFVCLHAYAQTDPLPSWADGPAKQAIIQFVKTTTDKSNSDFVPPEARIATFDQDGTTWVSHPMYTQVVYCLERVPAVVARKPELKNVEPFKTVLSGDREAIAKLPTKDLLKILAATLSGMTVDEFKAEVAKWMAAAKHPRWDRLYTELTYQPMLEVMRYLRENGYARREYAYGPAEGLPNTKVGTFTQALYDEAKSKGWIIISMKNDWKRIFAFEQ
jgi:hypothetical protein